MRAADGRSAIRNPCAERRRALSNPCAEPRRVGSAPCAERRRVGRAVLCPRRHFRPQRLVSSLRSQRRLRSELTNRPVVHRCRCGKSAGKDEEGAPRVTSNMEEHGTPLLLCRDFDARRQRMLCLGLWPQLRSAACGSMSPPISASSAVSESASSKVREMTVSLLA